MDNKGYQIDIDVSLDQNENDVKEIPQFCGTKSTEDTNKSSTRSIKKSKSHDVQTEVTPLRVPDGGWGWMVVLGAFISHTVGNGLEQSKGILYLELLSRFHKSSTETTWVLTLSSSLGFLGGPLLSGLCERISCRTTCFIGAVLAVTGILVSGFAPNLTVLYFSYGILIGIGKTLTYAACIIMLGQYFNKRLGLAVGLTTAGIGVGSFAFPPLVEFLFATYSAQGAFMVLAAIIGNMFVTAALFRPIRSKPTRNPAKPDCNGNDTSQTKLPTVSEKLQNDNKKANKFKKKKKPRLSLHCNLLCNVAFAATCLQVILHHMAKQAVLMFLPAFAISKGITAAEAAFLLSGRGISEAVAKCLMTIILDTKHIKPYRLAIYSCVVMLMGVLALSLPSLTNFLQFMIVSSVYGLLSGTRSQKTIVIVDTLGAKHLTGAVGWLLLFQGIGSIVGPTVAAVYMDRNGSYNMAIYLGAVGHLAGGLCMAAGTLWLYCTSGRRRSKLPR